MNSTLAQNLVTVAEYRRFIEDGGYHDEGWWTPKGWSWISHEGVGGPRMWGDDEWAGFFTDDRPIVFVSWFEASAYCAWLGGGARLPTEAEWEAAVRGDDDRLFPWGHRWEDGRVGNRGVGPRVTWPVGSWPQAVGPYGHHDLVGNVWQLCDDDWGGERLSKVARGGAWSAPNHQCRADSRNGFRASGRHSHLGFRVATS